MFALRLVIGAATVATASPAAAVAAAAPVYALDEAWRPAWPRGAGMFSAVGVSAAVVGENVAAVAESSAPLAAEVMPSGKTTK